MRPHAFVLLSGGIDSTTCLHIAVDEMKGAWRDYKRIIGNGGVMGISFNYGQRHKKEIEFAEAQCKALGVEHRTLPLTGIIPDTALTNTDTQIPSVPYSEIEGVSPAYVPFRNGLMLSALASHVSGAYESMKSGLAVMGGPEWRIYFGAHAEDAANWAYPDCTPEFIGAMANAIWTGTYKTVRLFTPLQWLNKAEIIRKGADLGVDFSATWSCYDGQDVHCGVCPTCRARRIGFKQAGVIDPTVYAK